MVSLIFTRGLSASAALNHTIKNIVVVGSGLMGSGIAQVSAQSEFNVILVDQSYDILNKAKANIASSVTRVAKKQHEGNEKAQKSFVSKVLENIAISTDVVKSASQADLVIEAVVENVNVKQKLFQQIETSLSSNGIITSNTSSLKLYDIGKNLKNKQNFGGLHFFNPVPMMKLLEVVRHDETSEATFNSLVAFGKSLGKVTVACKDTPGFIVNRLLVPYLFEAIRLYERGDASKEDIDVAMKLGAGYPMGPFELADYVGLDTCQFIQKGWQANYPSEPLFTTSNLLNKLVAEGKFGRKSGEGFYKYK